MSIQTEQEHAGMMRTRDREAMAKEDKKGSVKNYKGFVAGVFSGIAKLTG
jgi:hypothetical protein